MYMNNGMVQTPLCPIEPELLHLVLKHNPFRYREESDDWVMIGDTISWTDADGTEREGTATVRYDSLQESLATVMKSWNMNTITKQVLNEVNRLAEININKYLHKY